MFKCTFKFTSTFVSAFLLEVITWVPIMLGSLLCCLPRPKPSTVLELPKGNALGGSKCITD